MNALSHGFTCNVYRILLCAHDLTFGLVATAVFVFVIYTIFFLQFDIVVQFISTFRIFLNNINAYYKYLIIVSPLQKGFHKKNKINRQALF